MIHLKQSKRDWQNIEWALIIPKTRFLADPPSGGVSSRFTLVRVSVRPCVCGQLTKLFNIFGSGLDIFLKSSGDIPRMFVH